MTAVKPSGKVSQIDRFPAECAIYHGDNEDRAKDALAPPATRSSGTRE